MLKEIFFIMFLKSRQQIMSNVVHAMRFITVPVNKFGWLVHVGSKTELQCNSWIDTAFTQQTLYRNAPPPTSYIIKRRKASGLIWLINNVCRISSQRLMWCACYSIPQLPWTEQREPWVPVKFTGWFHLRSNRRYFLP